jgi:hypothetical protein
MRNTKVSSSVLLVSISKDINVIKKIASMSFWMIWMQFFNFFYYIYVLSNGHQKTQEEILAFLSVNTSYTQESDKSGSIVNHHEQNLQ